MPVTVHKLLVHGCDIVKNFNIPIGFLSEEALEARHKEIRSFRLNHSRKSSRINNNVDVFKRMILSSDPLITSKRKLSTQKHGLSEDILPFLILPEVEVPDENCDIFED